MGQTDRKMSAPLALVADGDPMAPENIETRVSVNEVKLSSLENQQRVLAPLALELPLMRQELQTLSAALARNEAENRERSERLDKDLRDDFNNALHSIEKQILALQSEVGKCADSIKAESKARADEATARKQERSGRTQLWATLTQGLVVAIIGAIAVIVAALLAG